MAGCFCRERCVYLVAAVAEPAAGREVEGALGAGGHVGEAEVAVAVHPGAAHYHIVCSAVGGHQAEHLPCFAQLNAGPPCKYALVLNPQCPAICLADTEALLPIACVAAQNPVPRMK